MGSDDDDRGRRRKRGQRTVVHGEAAEEGENIGNGVLRRDAVEILGQGMGDEDAVVGRLAAGVEVDLFEGGEVVVVKGQIDGVVDVCGEGVVCGGRLCGRMGVWREDRVRGMGDDGGLGRGVEDDGGGRLWGRVEGSKGRVSVLLSN